MTQTIYTGTAGADAFDASDEAGTDIAVFRAIGTGDTVRGGAGADRISLLGKGATASLGSGDDLFLTVLDTRAVDSTGATLSFARDSIDGGAGTDTLNITASTYQMTDAVKAELVRLEQYLGGDTTQHFVSDMLHIDMVNLETANIRVDGRVVTLASVAPVAVNHVAVIGGAATGVVTEDGTLTASGTLSITDADAGQAKFQAITGAALHGTYGDFTFNAETGAWGYTLNNAAANVQALTGAQSVTDTLHVTSLDGSAGQDIILGIQGANEAAATTTITFGFENMSLNGESSLFISTFAESGFTYTNTLAYGSYGVSEDYLSGLYGISGNGGQAMWTQGGSITRADHGVFAVDSVMDTATSYQEMHIEGYHAGTKIYDLAITSTSWHTDTLNWTGVDEVRIKGASHGGLMTDGWVFH